MSSLFFFLILLNISCSFPLKKCTYSNWDKVKKTRNKFNSQGLKIGWWIEKKDNSLIYITRYDEGVPVGRMKILYKDGGYTNGQFKNGKREGKWVSINDDGSIHSIDYYKDGEIVKMEKHNTSKYDYF